MNFPVLTRADVEGWVRRRESMDQTTWFLALLDWARDELAARRDAQPGR